VPPARRRWQRRKAFSAAVARLAAHAASFQLATLNQTLRFAMRWMNKSYLFLLRLLSGLKCPPRVVVFGRRRARHWLWRSPLTPAVGNGSWRGRRVAV